MKIAIAVTAEEGGNWIPFLPRGAHGRFDHPCLPKTVHAILFEDGSIWDATVGWRKLARDKEH